jgi:hypothetical protein
MFYLTVTPLADHYANQHLFLYTDVAVNIIHSSSYCTLSGLASSVLSFPPHEFKLIKVQISLSLSLTSLFLLPENDKHLQDCR